jgi:cellobiose-specific phosphotransferase system component IIC
LVTRKITFSYTGGPGHTVFSSFSAAVLVAGGSGITFALSIIHDLIQKDLEKESRVKVIELIWIIQDSG